MSTLSRIGGRALADLLPDLRSEPGPVYSALARSVSALVLDGRIVTETRPEQILITNGSLHGLDLLLRLLIGPGDRVLTELPSYPGALDAVRANGGRLVPVPMASEGGWQVEQLQATLRQTAARVAYLMPDF